MTITKKIFLKRLFISTILWLVVIQVFYYARFSVLAVTPAQLSTARGESPWAIMWFAFFFPFAFSHPNEVLPGCLGLIIDALIIYIKGPVEMIKGLSNFILVTGRGYILTVVLCLAGLATATYGLWSRIPEPFIPTGWREMYVCFAVVLAYYALFSYTKDGDAEYEAFRSLYRAALLIFASCFVTWGNLIGLDMLCDLSTVTKEPFSKTILAHCLEIAGYAAMSIATAKFTFNSGLSVFGRISTAVCCLSSAALMLTNLGPVENTVLQYITTDDLNLIRSLSIWIASVSSGVFAFLLIPHFHKNLKTI